LPFNFIISAPSRSTVINITIGGSISIRLAINTANTPARRPPRHANSLKMQHFGTFLKHPDQRFLLSDPDFRSVDGHPAPASSGRALNRPIRSRISRKSALGTTTSAIWNTTYRECLTTLPPILISFSRSVLSDHFFTDLGNARRRRKLPRL
jgi:hypothetical protein